MQKLNASIYLARGRHTSKFLLKFSFLVKCACHAMAKHLLESPILNNNNNNIYSNKFRHLISAARFTRPPQYIHQNERLGREWGAITFLADTRYHGDVIRKKRRPKTPFTFNGGKQKKS